LKFDLENILPRSLTVWRALDYSDFKLFAVDNIVDQQTGTNAWQNPFGSPGRFVFGAGVLSLLPFI
jgi:hypothetical protein